MQVAVAASATASRINLVVYAASANLRPRRRLAKYNILKYYTVNVHERYIKYAPCYERERACALMEMSNVVSKNVRHQRKATMNYNFAYTSLYHKNPFYCCRHFLFRFYPDLEGLCLILRYFSRFPSRLSLMIK